MKMSPVLWVVDFGIVRCCRRRVSIDNIELNFSELIFGDIPYLSVGSYGLKVLK